MADRVLLKPSEVAEAIGSSRTTVYELIASKQLASVKVGKDLRVPVRALEAWIQRQLDPTKAETV